MVFKKQYKTTGTSARNSFTTFNPGGKNARRLISGAVIRALRDRGYFSLVVILAASIFLSAIPTFSAGASRRFNMSYVYFGSGAAYYQLVENTKNSLDEISPNYFNLTDDGNLELTPATDTDFVNAMHQKGIKVVPFLSNHWKTEKGIKALENREKLAGQIANAVVSLNLDGVNVDIENVTHEQRDMYTDFVRILRDKLPEGKTLAVAVAANPNGKKTGWQGSYDYRRLAEYSDYLMIMAYDESYPEGPPGPVASYSFVENTIKMALTEAPKEKLVLGIPFYGRYWKNGAAIGGYGLSNTDVVRLVSMFNGKITFDTKTKSPKVEITIAESDPKPYVLGKCLEAGTYTIWFENETSIKYKLDLVNKYDLKGTGSWSLGQETLDTWDYYAMWLNGYYFEDAQGHWAQGSIISMADKKWMTGVAEHRFAPDNTLTRAEAAVILVRALGLKENTGNPAYFNDISGHWAENEILTAAQNGLVLGTGNGRFSPDYRLTRQEMAVMLDRVLSDLKDVTGFKNPFKDVSKSKNDWSYNSIMKLAYYGIYTGNPDGTFGPDKVNTRAQMAVVMDRISGFLGGSGSVLASK